MSVPYLCGGTFLTQVLRAQADRSIKADYLIGIEPVGRRHNSNHVIFNALIAVYKLDEKFEDAWNIKEFRSQTSKFKNCKQGFPKNAKRRDINDTDKPIETDILRQDFDNDIASDKPKSLDIINAVINDLLDSEVLRDVVYSLLEMIENDTTISADAKFFVNGNGQYVTKKELLEMTELYVAPFLLGVWHFIIQNRFDKNREGEKTIAEWYKNQNEPKFPLGEKYRQSVKVLFECKKDHDIETDTKRIFETLEKHEKKISELSGRNDNLTRCLEIIGNITLSEDDPDKDRFEKFMQTIKPFFRKIKNYKLSNGIPKRLHVIMDKPLIDSCGGIAKEIQSGEVSDALCALVEEAKQIHADFYSGEKIKAEIAIESARKIYSSLFPGDSDFA